MRNDKALFTLTVSLAFLLVFAVPARSAERSIVPVPVKDKSGNKVLLYKESHALLIGVSAYTGGWPELRGVQEDVRSVKKVLEKNGFHVVVVENPTRERMEKAFNDFIIQYGQGENDRVLVYYAGHGHTLKLLGGEMGYIVPADAPNPNRDRKGFLARAVDMQMMEVYAKRIQAKHALFLFDSCFSGSLFDVGRAIPENIGHKTSKPIRQFITAGSADETVPDHSVFREQFVAALEGEADTDKDGYVTGAELGEFLHKTVVNYSRSAQHPQYGKIRDPRLDKGDFVFPLRTAGLAPPGAGQADLPQERQRLEDERAQLEAERKKLEEEKKRMEVASLPRVNFDAGLAAYNRKDYAAALRNFKPLAEQGNGDAQVWLGHMYENGFGAPQDLEQATAWYRKAAEQGHAGGQYHLGLMYEFAMGVPQDLDQAMAWYRKAADQGHSEAMSFLKNAEKKRLETASLPRGDLAAGKAAFERSDFAAALRNFKPLAEQGNAEAQFRVGVLYHLYHKEMGTPQDDALAVTWYRKAAEQGHVGAQNNLGDMYLGGRGVPQDNTQGVALIRKAAEQGYAAAQRHLGTLYEGGSIIPRDLEQAKTWYRKAAEQGDFLAAEFLKGLMKGR